MQKFGKPKGRLAAQLAKPKAAPQMTDECWFVAGQWSMQAAKAHKADSDAKVADALDAAEERQRLVNREERKFEAPARSGAVDLKDPDPEEIRLRQKLARRGLRVSLKPVEVAPVVTVRNAASLKEFIVRNRNGRFVHVWADPALTIAEVQAQVRAGTLLPSHDRM